MDATSSSLASVPAGPPKPAATMVGEWHRYGRFLRRPTLPVKATGITSGAIAALLRIFALDIAVMAVLIAVALAAIGVGIEFPANTLENIEWNAAWIALVVLVAPFYEELFFRSWLSGKWPALVAAIVSIVGFAIAAMFVAPSSPFAGGAGPIIAAVVVIVTIVSAVWIGLKSRHTAPFGWFAKAFPLFFYLASAGFAVVHFFNYDDALPLWQVLPLVIPQFIAGTMFGYLRVQYGFWAAVAMHVLHNGTALGTALLMESLFPGVA